MVMETYRAYLLRLWRVEDEGSRWRARLENVDTGEARGFASLDKLVEFLQHLGEEGDEPGKEVGKKTDDL